MAMCTYNGSRFLGEQLQSIAAQERLPDEVVICDDRSSDRSAEIVATFSERVLFPVRFFVNQETLGSTKNFEKAISLCQGDIVALSDQDDVWCSHKLARVEQMFLTSDAVAMFSDAELIDDESTLLNSRLWASFSFVPAEQKRFSTGHGIDVLIKHPVVTGAAMAFRRKFFEVLAPIPQSDIHDRWISFLLAACGEFSLVSEPLMQYRRHHNQQVGIGAQTFRDRVARARITGEELYASEIERFQRLHDRLDQQRERIPDAERAMREIRRKISHLEHRIEMREMKLARIPRVLREVCNQGYWRYAAGWESVAKDLFMFESR